MQIKVAATKEQTRRKQEDQKKRKLILEKVPRELSKGKRFFTFSSFLISFLDKIRGYFEDKYGDIEEVKVIFDGKKEGKGM